MGKTRKLKTREKLVGRKRGKGRGREPVIISFTTLFRPLLARLRQLDSGCQTIEMSMTWNLSQISREIISRGAHPLCES